MPLLVQGRCWSITVLLRSKETGSSHVAPALVVVGLVFDRYTRMFGINRP